MAAGPPTIDIVLPVHNRGFGELERSWRARCCWEDASSLLPAIHPRNA
jgi:hypothetical protein